MKQINFRKHPYRGIWTEAARKLNMRRQHVQRSYLRANPRVVRIVNDLIAQRRTLVGGRHAA